MDYLMHEEILINDRVFVFASSLRRCGSQKASRFFLSYFQDCNAVRVLRLSFMLGLVSLIRHLKSLTYNP